MRINNRLCHARTENKTANQIILFATRTENKAGF